MKTIKTDKAPAALGHYSQAIVHDGIAYVAGQLPIDPNNPDAPHGSVEEQAKQTLDNLKHVLEAAGSSMQKALKVTIYITDVNDWAQVNSVYAECFGDHKPARTAVPVKELPKGFKVEIDAIAAL